MRKILFHFFLAIFGSFIFFSCKNNCVDADGNVYKTVKIGNQVWMAENLKTTRYQNGDSIPHIISNAEWKNLTSGAYCNFDNTANNVFGKLYNWYAATDTRNIAPKGWHVATDADWKALADFIKGDGGKIKASGQKLWRVPNTGATNESGFTALPAGLRLGYDGTFVALGILSNFWSSNSFGDTPYAWDFRVSYNNTGTHRANINKRYGFSVRCVKD